MEEDNLYFILKEFVSDANVYTSLQRSLVVTCTKLAMCFCERLVALHSAIVCIEAKIVLGL